MTTYQRRMAAQGIATKPIVIDYRRGRRLYWAPSRYTLIGSKTLGRSRWTLRELAQATGYTISGLRKALARLASWGAISVTSTRGWSGFTRIRWAADVLGSRANVSPTVRSESPERRVLPVAVEDTLLPQAPGGSWREACAALFTS